MKATTKYQLPFNVAGVWLSAEYVYRAYTFADHQGLVLGKLGLHNDWQW